MLSFFFIWYRYLTRLQLTNYEDNAYKNMGVFMDLPRILKFIFQAHGPLLIASGFGVLTLAIRVFGLHEIIYNGLVVALLCLAMVISLRLLGLYPAVAVRHIIWVV